MDLVRLLLMRSEGGEEAEKAAQEFSIEERAYHVQLLIDAGLVEGITRRDQDGKFTGAVVSRLTSAGHDFLQSIRDESLWNKARKQVLQSGSSWTFDILKEWAEHEVKQKLGLP